jgi:hypothetical protein
LNLQYLKLTIFLVAAVFVAAPFLLPSAIRTLCCRCCCRRRRRCCLLLYPLLFALSLLLRWRIVLVIVVTAMVSFGRHFLSDPFASQIAMRLYCDRQSLIQNMLFLTKLTFAFSFARTRGRFQFTDRNFLSILVFFLKR